MITFAIQHNLDYISNGLINYFPDGQDVEVVKFKSLHEAWKNAKLKSELEHVTPYIINNSDFKGKTYFKAKNFKINLKKDYSKVRMTVDYYSDFETINTLINNLGFNKNWIEYADFILENKKLFSNQMLTRNESFYNQLLNEKKILKGLDKNYIKRQKTLFQVVLCFFKRPEMFLPDLWPSYYSKAKKQYVWDLDNNKYLDMSIMAIGTNILGYANKHVDNAVIKNIRKSNMSTFNCPEEVKLAEKLLELDDWAQMVRFAKTEAKPLLQLGLQEQALENQKLLYAVIMVGMTGIYLLITQKTMN